MTTSSASHDIDALADSYTAGGANVTTATCSANMCPPAVFNDASLAHRRFAGEATDRPPRPDHVADHLQLDDPTPAWRDWPVIAAR